MSREIVTGVEVADFVARTLNVSFCAPYTTLGIKRGDEVVAGIVFNCYTGNDVELTVAGNDLPRAFLRRVGKYVINELGCIRATITTEQDKVVESAERLGGQIEGRKRNHFGEGRDGIMLGILREDWKFR